MHLTETHMYAFNRITRMYLTEIHTCILQNHTCMHFTESHVYAFYRIIRVCI